MSRNEILLVDDDPGMIQFMGRMLARVGHQRFATNGESALRFARETTPDLVLLDAEMPGMSGFQVCQVMKEDPALRHVPVIFVTSHCEPEFEITGLGIGAADFITKPVREPLLLARVEAHLRAKRLIDDLRRTATVDLLTGLQTKGAFCSVLEREWRRALRAGFPVAMLRVEIDHFPQFTDRYGPQAADQCQRLVAKTLRATMLRPQDSLGYLGAGQFAILLPQTRRAGAEHVAHRVLDAIEALAVPHELSLTARHATVSLGLSCYDEDSACWTEPSDESRFARAFSTLPTSAELAAASDKALSAAKHAGRAQAWRLDIADVESPTQAAEIAAIHRLRAGRRRRAR